MRRKLQRISAAALSALEHQLREQHLPVEERAFLAARLESYRRADALAMNAGCGHPDGCLA
ncbi:hypothetical protein [Azohydromonas australica]|uniref:hypothetical protein n=1 Tax=Azohydromonas australica TaxID=364039 RepID=UPI0012EB0984|nr:hypothetical protein [Azohydromonas australica]